MNEVFKLMSGFTVAELNRVIEYAESLKVELKPKPKLMKGFDEYQGEVLEARQDGEDLPVLAEQFMQNGYQFRLSPAQQTVLEGYVDKLASNEVTVYNILWDGKQEHVLEFSLQCNVSRYQRKAGLVHACAIDDARGFFSKVKQLEDEGYSEKAEAKAKAKPKPKKPSVDDLADMYLS